MNSASSASLPATYVRLVLTAFFWAGVFHVGQIAVQLMSPFATAAWRFLIAGLLFVPVVKALEGWDWAGLKRNAPVLALMSFVGVLGFNVSLFYGLQHTSPVNAALIVGINPPLTAVLSAIVGRQRPTLGQVLGLLLGMAGVAVVVSHGSWQALAALQLQGGDAWVLCGALCWALYTVIAQRFVKGVSPVQIAGSTVFGGGVMLAAAALFIAPDFPTLPTPAGWLAVASMAVFGSVIAYLWWNRGIKVVGATQAAICMNFVPLFSALIGVLRGHPLLGSQMAGAALIIAGVLVAALMPARLAGRTPPALATPR